MEMGGSDCRRCIRQRPGRVRLLFSFGASTVHNQFPMELHRSAVNQRHLLTVALVVVLFYFPTHVNSTQQPQQVVFELNYPLRNANSSVAVNLHNQRSDLYNLFNVQYHPMLEKKTGLKVTLQSLMTRKFICMRANGDVYTWKPRNRTRRNRWRTIPSSANEIPAGANEVIKEKVELEDEIAVAPRRIPQDCYFIYSRQSVIASHTLVSYKHMRPGKEPGKQRALYLRFRKHKKSLVGKWFRYPLKEGHEWPRPNQPNIRVELKSLEGGELKSLINSTPFMSRGKAVRNCLVRNVKNPDYLLSTKLEDLTSDKLHNAIRWCRRRIKNRRMKRRQNPRLNEISKLVR